MTSWKCRNFWTNIADDHPRLKPVALRYNNEALFHSPARIWWEGPGKRTEPIGIPWVVASGFVRLLTHGSLREVPATPERAIDYVEEWFQFPHVMPINPGVDHLTHLRRNLAAAGVGGNLVTDAHIAALAMEYQAEVHSNDTDFSRFPGLKWHNPLR